MADRFQKEREQEEEEEDICFQENDHHVPPSPLPLPLVGSEGFHYDELPLLSHHHHPNNQDDNGQEAEEGGGNNIHEDGLELERLLEERVDCVDDHDGSDHTKVIPSCIDVGMMDQDQLGTIQNSVRDDVQNDEFGTAA